MQSGLKKMPREFKDTQEKSNELKGTQQNPSELVVTRCNPFCKGSSRRRKKYQEVKFQIFQKHMGKMNKNA